MIKWYRGTWQPGLTYRLLLTYLFNNKKINNSNELSRLTLRKQLKIEPYIVIKNYRTLKYLQSNLRQTISTYYDLAIGTVFMF